MLKKNLNLTIIISLIIVISLSATYAYVELRASDSTSTGEAGCFEVDYTGGPSLNDADLIFQSSTDYVEVQSTYVILSKNEGCQIYTEAQINLYTDLSIDDAAPLCLEEDSDGYTEEACSMKYRVMQGDNLISEGTVAAQTDQELATVPLTTEPTTYTVYLWIDSSTSNGLYNGKSYSGYIYATSIQSSTIK